MLFTIKYQLINTLSYVCFEKCRETENSHTLDEPWYSKLICLKENFLKLGHYFSYLCIETNHYTVRIAADPFLAKSDCHNCILFSSFFESKTWYKTKCPRIISSCSSIFNLNFPLLDNSSLNWIPKIECNEKLREFSVLWTQGNYSRNARNVYTAFFFLILG